MKFNPLRLNPFKIFEDKAFMDNEKLNESLLSILLEAIKKGFLLDEMIKIIKGQRDLRSTKPHIWPGRRL